MKIVNAIATLALTGFYFDDQAAIKKGAKLDRFIYEGSVMTKNFKTIRQAGEALSIMLVLEDGQVAYGDACAVQYSGCGGRDELFYGEDALKTFNTYLKDALIGCDVSSFKENAITFDHFEIGDVRIHTALRYGITQALLDATAKANKCTMSEIVRKEYAIEGDYEKIPVFAQSGDDRYDHADKMIIKEADVLPHALINNVKTKLGENGELLKDYIKWLSKRILNKRKRSDYQPILHIDVYGTIGIIFDGNTDKIFEYLKTLAEYAEPFLLRIEGPIDTGDKEGTIQALANLKRKIDKESLNVEIVADEWCNTLEDVKAFAEHDAAHMLQIKTPDLGGINNTIEALIYCREKGVSAYSGGSCNETNISAEVTTSIAIACEAKQCLAKPGMGTDEGFMIVKNHMARTLALIESRRFHD
jgi:methylaspartate ammonia-lyase